TDGSKLPDGKSGGGFVIYQLDRQISSGAFPLGTHQEAYDTEVYAALRGIQAATVLPTARFANNLWIFVDNIEVAKKLLTKPSLTSSQSSFLSFLEIAEKWKNRPRLPHTHTGQVNVRWVPSHSGISGNELADLEAKRGAMMPSLEEPKFSLAALRKWHAEKTTQLRDTSVQEIKEGLEKVDLDSLSPKISPNDKVVLNIEKRAQYLRDEATAIDLLFRSLTQDDQAL
ncbi:hypothetical protein K3495_g16720, partial [Podosphaera aphanis]